MVVVVFKRHFFRMPNRKRATVSTENPHFMLSPSFNQMESGSAVTRTVQSSSPILTRTSALGIKIPCSKSDLSAILAGGRQVVSQVVSRSNPELGIRYITNHGKLDQQRVSSQTRCYIEESNFLRNAQGSPLTVEASGFPVSCESPLHYPQKCTSGSSLCSSSTSTVAGQGRIRSSSQQKLQ